MVILWKDAQGHSTQRPPSLTGFWMPSQNHPKLPKTLVGSWIERQGPWEGSLGSLLVCLVIFTVVTCKLLVTIFTLKDVPLQSQLECLILFLIRPFLLSICPHILARSSTFSAFKSPTKSASLLITPHSLELSSAQAPRKVGEMWDIAQEKRQSLVNQDFQILL